MSLRRCPHWFAALALGLLLGTPAAAAPNVRKVDSHLRKAKVTRTYGLVVHERGPGGRTVLSRGADRSLIPASVAKVVTGAAALDVLGPGYEFHTRIAIRGTRAGDELRGDLIVHGSGDPTTGEGTSTAQIMEEVTALAQAVHAHGIRRVSGALVLDDGVFDRATFHPVWPKGDIVQRYGAGVGGLTFHHGCARLAITGSARAGDPATVHALTTSAGLRVKNQVTTIAGTKRAALSAHVSGKTLVVKGKIGPKKRGTVEVPVPLPQYLFGSALQRALQRAGVRVAEPTRLVRDAADGVSDETLFEIRTPLRDVIKTMNVKSQNQYASAVFKALGAAVYGRGTWASGQRAVHRALRKRGVEPGEGPDAPIQMLDGSGLSIENRFTAGALAALLASFDADPLRGPWLYASLATSGVDGTLRKRLADRALKERIHAKTGTLGDVRVRSLAGYVDGRKGHPGYVFAIVLNKGIATHTVVDDLVRALFK